MVQTAPWFPTTKARTLNTMAVLRSRRFVFKVSYQRGEGNVMLNLSDRLEMRGKREEKKYLSCCLCRAWSSGSNQSSNQMVLKEISNTKTMISLQTTFCLECSCLSTLFLDCCQCSLTVSISCPSLPLTFMFERNAIHPPSCYATFFISCRSVQSMQQQPPQWFPSSRWPPPAWRQHQGYSAPYAATRQQFALAANSSFPASQEVRVCLMKALNRWEGLKCFVQKQWVW
jgi:hypothetical protein